MHENGVVHQDLKPANVLLSEDREIIKLCDFGVSNALNATQKASVLAQQGTFRYMAQEQLDCLLTSKIDIWALGCIMLQCVSGEEPYTGVVNELAVAHELCMGRSPIEHSFIKKKKTANQQSAQMFFRTKNVSGIRKLRSFIDDCLTICY